MIKKRTVFLFVVLLLLMCFTILLTIVEEGKQHSAIDENAFAVEDTARIDMVIIKGKDFKNVLKKGRNAWSVNGNYQADAGMVKELLSVLHDVQVRQPIAPGNTEKVLKEITLLGATVDVYEGENLLKSFMAGGEGDNNISYFAQEGNGLPALVHIPGDDTFLAGIFYLGENDWRTKAVFPSNRNLIQQIKVIYPAHPDNGFEIKQSENFFQITGLNHPDTSRLMQYISQFSSIKAEAYINEGIYQKYDTLIAKLPFIKIQLQDSGSSKTTSISFYRPLPDQSVLGIMENAQMAVFAYPKIKGLFVKREELSMKE